MPAADQKNRRVLVARAAKGVTWSGLGIAFQRITQTIIVIILARILVPDDFGLVAIATMTINLVEKIKGLGMTSAFIQRQSETEKAANALFYFNMAASLVVYAMIYFCAPLIASFFNSVSAKLVLRIMALQIFADAGAVVPRALAVKRLYFKKLTLINFCGSITGGFLSLLLAVTGYGVWALVYGALAGASVIMILWWLFGSWRPKRSLDWPVMKEMLGFGVRLSVADAMDGIINTCNRIFVGRFLGITSLGLYDVTMRIVQLPFRNIITAGNRVALPAFCKLQDDEDEIRRWYLKMIGYSSLIMAPLAICLILLAGHFVVSVLGEKWSPIIPYLRLLGPAVFFLPLLYTRPIYVSLGRTDLLLKFVVIRLVATVPILYLASKVSLLVLCQAEIMTLAIFSIFNQWLVTKIIGLPAAELLRTFEAPLAGAAAVAMTLLAGDFLLSKMVSMPDMTVFCLLLPAAVAVYLCLLHCRYPDKIREVKRMAALSMKRFDSPEIR